MHETNTEMQRIDATHVDTHLRMLRARTLANLASPIEPGGSS